MLMWRKQKADPAATPTAVQARARASAPAVLVVDADYHVRQIVRLVLEDAGYEVLVARDAADALAQLDAATAAIDLGVIDFNLPDIDGHRLATEINAVSPATRILYVSGRPADLFEDAVVPDSWFLQKPFTHAELLGRVAERLQR